MKKIFLILIVAISLLLIFCFSLSNRIGCIDNSCKYDDEYCDSVRREKQLKDVDLENAVEIERKARLERAKKRGGTKPDEGRSRVRNKGSKEQKVILMPLMNISRHIMESY